MKFATTPQGPFSLMLANQYFGGWTSFGPDPSTIVMCFPVEGWQSSAAVIMRQEDDGTVSGEVHCSNSEEEQAWQQALAALSLDSDGRGWPEVGQRDPVIGERQLRYQFLRPVLFHSPYEAAAAFIMGHRISIQQRRVLSQRMAQELGEQFRIGENAYSAFPTPQVLCDLTTFKGLNDEKIQRLRGVARATLDGLLDRAYLRSLPTEEALERLRAIPGIGPFFSQGILLRGAGVLDEIPEDDMTREAIQRAYNLPEKPTRATMLQIGETWRPYRMWCSVLLHVWLRREFGGTQRR